MYPQPLPSLPGHHMYSVHVNHQIPIWEYVYFGQFDDVYVCLIHISSTIWLNLSLCFMNA